MNFAFLVFGGILLCIMIIEIGRLVVLSRKAIAAGKRAIPSSQQSTTPSVRILVLGDSTSYGVGVTNPQYSLVGRLVHDFPNYTILNASENAMSLRRLKQKLQEMQNEKFDIIMLHIGGVDVLSCTPLRMVRSYLTDICSYATTMHTCATILISVNNTGAAPFFHFPLNKLFTWRSRRVSQECEKVSRTYGVVHVPLFVERTHEPLYHATGHHYSEDGIHPNDMGYALWYNTIKVNLLSCVQKLHS